MTLQRPSSPPWSAPPTKQWSLIEIKNGVEVAEHNLTRKLKHPKSKITVMGRATDEVDVVLNHDSISRFHARLAFDKESGTPWLRDLSSTHGVLVNKRRLPDNTIGQNETMSSISGSRGVIVFPNDIIQLGASTRYFVVAGPEDFNRDAVHSSKASLQQLSEGATAALTDDVVQSNSIDHIDTTDDFDNNDKSTMILSDDNIPERLRPKWEKIKAMQYKLENIEAESERIRAKGDVDALSDGQVKQLERNNQRIASLKDMITEKEAELHQWSLPTNQPQQRSHQTTDDDDDGVFDCTVVTNKQYLELDEDGETLNTLMVKWNDLLKKRNDITNKSEILSQTEASLELSKSGSKADVDDFFIQNDLSLIKDTKQKLQQEMATLLKHLHEVEEMIQVVDPKLKISSDGSTWSNEDIVDDRHGEKIMNDQIQGMDPSADAFDSFSKESKMFPSLSEELEITSQQSTMAPPLKRAKTSKISATAGTLAIIKATNTSSKEPNDKSRERNQLADEVNYKAQVNADQHDTWQVPSDQDGSGMTKLNAKFSGRY
jgi:pSer/pThr/pTyr-binding forkhead associated (FHA) protein